MITSKLGKLIIVDDEIDTLTPLCDLLSEWGYEVKGFTSGKDALEALKEKNSDMLLTDLVMPEMDGIELIKAAIKIDPLLVCMIMTGKGTIQTAVEAMKVGAFDYILKPIEWKILKPILSRAMETRRLRESEKKYRSIVKDQTELICRWKPSEILTFVNDVYCRYFNKRQEELLGHSFMTLIPEKDWDKVRKHFASLGPENPVSTHEHRVISPNGEICWQQWTNRALFDRDGNITEYQSVGRDITKRKLADEALRESDERYRELAGSITDVFFAMDKDLKYIYWNKASENLTGILEKEAVGKSLYELFPDTPEIRRAEKVYLDILRTQQPQNFINRYQIGDKEYVFEINAYPSKKGLSVFVKDITERKRVEEALRVSEVKLRDLYDNAPDMYHTLDENGVIIDCNETEAIMLGYKKEEIIGRPITDFFSEESKRLFKINFPKLHKENKLLNLEREFVRKDSTTFPAGLNVFSEYDENRKFIGTKTIARDISVLKQAGSALRDSEEKYRTLVDNALVGVYKTNLKGDFLFANEALARIMEFDSPEEMIAESVPKRYKDPKDRKVLIGKLRGNNKVESFEVDLLTKTGETRKVLLSAILEGDTISGMIMDITERKKAEEDLKKSHEQLRALAVRLTEVEEAERRRITQELHDDVGQSLTALGINLNILPGLLSVKSKPRIGKRLEDMHKLLEDTVKKIRDVMADLRPSVLDDYGLIAALRWYSEQFFNRTGITTVIRGKELEPRMPSVVETTLFRIAQESLTNVSKHAQAIKVTIKLTEKDNLIRLSIADDGIGFDPENIQQSREKFVWGLISMKERAVVMGGKFGVQSSPGKGTTIIVEIKRTA